MSSRWGSVGTAVVVVVVVVGAAVVGGAVVGGAVGGTSGVGTGGAGGGGAGRHAAASAASGSTRSREARRGKAMPPTVRSRSRTAMGAGWFAQPVGRDGLPARSAGREEPPQRRPHAFAGVLR